MLKLSIVIPVYNAENTLAACLNALLTQDMPLADFEIIVVDDGSTDGSARLASKYDVKLIRGANQGAPAARNIGVENARGTWVAFTDADCVPSRSWLSSLLSAVENEGGSNRAFGAAGQTIGYGSKTDAARFVDMVGGLDALRHLEHPRFPFAPTCNVMYLRKAVLSAGGFDRRFDAYDACDLHQRIRTLFPLSFPYVKHALVLHKHRSSWRDYWRQQKNYGRGLAQFMLKYRSDVQWTWRREAIAWGELIKTGIEYCFCKDADKTLYLKGNLIKGLAQRMGFNTTFWNPMAQKHWRSKPFVEKGRNVYNLNQLTRSKKLAPKFSPLGIFQRLKNVVNQPSDVILAVKILLFIHRLPAELKRQNLEEFLAQLRASARPSGSNLNVAVQRIIRLRKPWLRLARYRSYNTCYVRALTLFRFLDPGENEMKLHFIAEPPTDDKERLRGHAWVSINGQVIEEPGPLACENKVREIYSYSY